MEKTDEKIDQVLKCVWCDDEFVFNVGEQIFYEKHVDNNGDQLRPPKRCPACRLKKREEMRKRGLD